MKQTFVIKQKTINNMLASMQPICSKRTPLESTTGILFQIGVKELVLKSTDMEISLQYSVALSDTNLTEPAAILVPGKRIFELIKELDDELFFTIKNQEITIQAGGAKAHLNLKDVDMFPDFPERIENLLQLNSSFVKNMLDKVNFIIPQNNPNSALNGLYIELGPEGFIATATDGHCLAQITSSNYAISQKLSWLMPRRAVTELKKVLDNAPDETIFLGTCGNQLVFSGESFNFFTKLLNDKFPQYNAILSKEGFIEGKVERNSFIRTVRRSACLLSGQFLPTTFSFEDDALSVSLINKEVGTFNDRIAITGYSGESMQIRFYAPYLLGGLQNFSDTELHFYLNNFAKPIIFESAQENMKFCYLVMPVSPSNNI
jgi:DNA polymerase-3 subunit beta